MKPMTIRPGVYPVGAVDWDRRLFDALVPLPDGTSYNSYLVQGSEKTALIDTVDPSKQGVLLEHLEELDIKNIDYVVSHHAEQDHSGALPMVLAEYPGAKIVCSQKSEGMLIDHLMIPEDRFITVADYETLSLGNRTLEFIYTPWVHCPETMVTYLREDKLLFTGDFFGSHLATSDLYVVDEGQAYESAKRYFAEIMMPFRTNIQRNLEKLRNYTIDVIAPSHGPLYNRPEFILKLYHSWVFDEPDSVAVIAYVSMHGTTQKMVEYMTEALSQKGVCVKQFDLVEVDIGKLAMALVDAATLIVGTPTVLAGLHPKVAYAAFLANALRPKLKFATAIGSYGWGGKAIEQLQSLVPNLSVEFLAPVLVKGFPREADFVALYNLASLIAEKHKVLPMPSSWHISRV